MMTHVVAESGITEKYCYIKKQVFKYKIAIKLMDWVTEEL